jgi:hypothetical protein
MAEKQIELLRRASPRRRSAMMLAMTTTAIKRSRHAIQRLHPDWSELEVNLFWAEIHYGKDLADKVRAYLAAQGRL